MRKTKADYALTMDQTRESRINNINILYLFSPQHLVSLTPHPTPPQPSPPPLYCKPQVISSGSTTKIKFAPTWSCRPANHSVSVAPTMTPSMLLSYHSIARSADATGAWFLIAPPWPCIFPTMKIPSPIKGGKRWQILLTLSDLEEDKFHIMEASIASLKR